MVAVMEDEFAWMMDEDRELIEIDNYKIDKEDFNNNRQYYLSGKFHRDQEKALIDKEDDPIGKQLRVHRAMRKLKYKYRPLLKMLARGSTIRGAVDTLQQQGSSIRYQSACNYVRSPKFRTAYDLYTEQMASLSPLGTKARAQLANARVFEEAMKESPIFDKEGNIVGHKPQSLTVAAKTAAEALKDHRGGDAREFGGGNDGAGPGLTIIVQSPQGQQGVAVSPDGRTATIGLPEPDDD